MKQQGSRTGQMYFVFDVGGNNVCNGFNLPL